MVIIEKYPLLVSFKVTERILYQMENCICKVMGCSNTTETGTGFFCIIPYKGNKLKVLITASHIITKNDLLNSEIIRIELNNQLKEIDINDNRKLYTNEKFDITIIEINPYKDEIRNFLEIDIDIFKIKEIESIYYKSSIYTLQYIISKDNNKKGVSYGIIINLEKDRINHVCSTESSSGGGPILNLKTNKVIGIHFGSSTSFRFNIGTFLFYPINDFSKDNNLIKKNKEYTDKDFSNIKLISAGAYGKIYSAYSIKDKEEICLKRIDIEAMKKNYEENELRDFQQDLYNEINILKLLSYNENSVKYYGNYDNKNEIINEKIIVMERCDTNLKDFIEKRGRELSVKEIKNKFEGLNELFKIIQKKKIIHRDLKLDNLLIKYNKEKTDYMIKLGDYGLGKFKAKSNGIFSGLKGSIDTFAPEILIEKEPKYENTVDMFSLGIIFYQLSHNLRHPYGRNYIDFVPIYRKNYDSDNLNVEFSNSINNNDFKDLVKRMIKLNPKNRLSWEEYFEHPFFKTK